MPTLVRFSQLSGQRQALIRIMQSVNYGSVLGLTLADGEPILSSPPQVLVDLRLDVEEHPRPELEQIDFTLCTEVVRLMNLFDHIRSGEISKIEVRAGVARRITLEHRLFPLRPLTHTESERGQAVIRK